MDDRELSESLRRLPEARPGEAFTAEVLARVERDERRRTVAAGAPTSRAGGDRWRPTLLAAGLAAALVAAAGLWLTGGRPVDGAGGGAPPSAIGAEEPAEGAAVAPPSGAGEDAAPAATGSERRDERIESVPAGASSPERQASSDRPPVRRGSQATAAAAASDEPAGAAVDEQTVAALPGADFFAAPPDGVAAPALTSPAGGPAVADPAVERLARLRAERERLERRLVAFRRELPPAEPPVVLLDGGEGFDLVFDLGRWAALPPAGDPPGGTRPAVHSTQQPPRRF